MGFIRTLILLLPLLDACVRSQAGLCGDLLCPEGGVCAKGSVCVSGSLADACSGHGEGSDCSLGELGDGTCQGGLCIVGICGDGMVNGIEACDGTNLNGMTCVTFGSTDAAGLACKPDCSFDKSGCNGVCGDGHKGTEEQCDGDDFGGKTCADFSPPGTTNMFYRGGVPTCTINDGAGAGGCMVNTSTCTGGWCGDGTIQFGEDCDGTNLGQPAATCLSLGHPGAATPPTCDPMTCTYTEDSCSCGPNGPCPPTASTCVNNNGTYSCTTP